MRIKKLSLYLLAGCVLTLHACKSNQLDHDASGTFEADEIIVSAEESGKIITFLIEEGTTVSKDSIVGTIDPIQLNLQQQQVEARIASLSERTVDVLPQIKLLEDQINVQQTQLKNLESEKRRVENLLKADAATGKQLDEIKYQIETLQKQIQVTQQQIAVQQNSAATQNRSVMSEAPVLQKQADQLKDRSRRTQIINPISGTILTRYAMQGEMTAAGKPLYKIADISILNLKAYINGNQLSAVKLGQAVKVYVDDAKAGFKAYPGTISWIADKAEFTPKTIQTKDERKNLVYAIKVKVNNDGFLKIGMYGEVGF
ncbi:MAG: HlyD family secretion protein [Ferruginibacter sp.]